MGAAHEKAAGVFAPPATAQEKAQNDCKFTLPTNPRQLRAVAALLAGPVPREQLDGVVGASNSPGVILALRRRGLTIPCQLVERRDRDGRVCRPGVYHLTSNDIDALRDWEGSKWVN